MIRFAHKLLFGIVFVGTVPVMAQSLRFTDPLHDIGRVPHTQLQTHHFAFSNVGDRPVRILRVQSTCGCTVAKLAKTEFGAGESGGIAATLDPEKFSGRIRKSVSILTDDPVQARYYVTLTAEVERAGERLAARAAAAKVPPEITRPHVAGEVLVRFRPSRRAMRANSTMAEMAALAVQKGATAGRLIQADLDMVTLTLQGETVAEAIARLNVDPDVLYAQPNYTYAPRTTLPNDPEFRKQWHLHNTGQSGGVVDADIDGPEAWEIFQGSSTVGNGRIVAVLDNGVDYDHPDLAGRLWDGSDCLDEHGQPLGDCIHGYDYSNAGQSGVGDKNPHPGSSDHGTHVAGLIGAVPNNSIGVSGVTADVKLMIVRSSGYRVDELVRGIYFAKHNGATIINASWGYSYSNNCQNYDEALYDAVADFPGLFVMAAGNASKNHNLATFFDSADFGHTSPCWNGLGNFLSVTSSDKNDRIVQDYGIAIDIAAPGQSIYSLSTSGGYTNKSGTSMAAPLVVGAAALVWGFRPGLTAMEVREVLRKSGDCVEAKNSSGLARPLYTTGNGYCSQTQAKRLNVYNALASIATPTVPVLQAFTDDTVSAEIGAGSLTPDRQPYWQWLAPQGQGDVVEYLIAIDGGDVYSGTTTDLFFDAEAEGLFLADGEHTLSVIGRNDLSAEGEPVSLSFSVSSSEVALQLQSLPASVGEGQALSIDVTLLGVATGPISVQVNVHEGEALIDSGPLAWANDETGVRSRLVGIADNVYDQAPRAFTVSLADAQGAPLIGNNAAVVSVIDDDEPPGILILPARSQAETGTLEFAVSLTEISGKQIDFSYTAVGDTATADGDFSQGSGVGSIAPFTSGTTVSVPVLGDTTAEGDETVMLTITASDQGAVEASRSSFTAIGTIVDDDVAVPVVQGWSVVSVTVAADDPATESVLGHLAGSRLWRWNAERQRFELAEALQAGTAYFLFAPDADALSYADGTPVTTDTIVLAPGWNFVAVPRAVHVSVFRSVSNGRAWEYRGGRYQAARRMEPGNGYWLYSANGGSVSLAE